MTVKGIPFSDIVLCGKLWCLELKKYNKQFSDTIKYWLACEATGVIILLKVQIDTVSLENSITLCGSSSPRYIAWRNSCSVSWEIGI